MATNISGTFSALFFFFFFPLSWQAWKNLFSDFGIYVRDPRASEFLKPIPWLDYWQDQLIRRQHKTETDHIFC